jgi:hypothetical protein
MTRKGHVDAMKPSKLVFWDTSMSKDTKKTQKKTASVEGSAQVEGAVVEMDIVEEEKTTCFVSITDATMRSAGRHNAEFEPSMTLAVSTSSEDDGEGHIFGYFPEMLEADGDATFEIFIRYFKYSFASSVEEFAEKQKVFRRGFRMLSGTQAGKIIQHIYFGMSLCEETGMSLALITDGGSYAGFKLIGDVPLLLRGQKKIAVSGSDMLEELAALNEHSAAVRKFFDTVVEIGRADGSGEPVTFDMLCRYPRLLRQMVQARSPKDINEIQSILAETIRDMKYSQTYLEINTENIGTILQAIIAKSSSSDLPFYVSADTVFNRSSMVVEYLAAFGPQAPSFFHGSKGVKIVPHGDDDENLVVVGKKTKLPYLPVYKKGISAALLDWASMVSSKSIKYTPSKAPSAFCDTSKTHCIISGKDFVPYYNQIKTILYMAVPAKQVKVDKGKGKRRAESDVEESEDDVRPLKKLQISYV